MSVGQIRIIEGPFLNLGGRHGPYFMANLWPFWLKIAILGHRQSQRPQMGWALVEHG